MIAHAFPFSDTARMHSGVKFNPFARNYFVVACSTGAPEPGQFLDVRHLGELFCLVLGVFYGKRFHNHGSLEENGFYGLPITDEIRTTRYPETCFSNDEPRPDLEIPLDLSRFGAVSDLVFAPTERWWPTFRAAGVHYLEAIRSFDYQPEIAYLHLVTAGEILGYYYEYPDEALYDDALLGLLRQVGDDPKYENYIDRIRKLAYQVKRRFTITLARLLNEDFFAVRQSSEPECALDSKSISARLGAAYDLRSQYLHTGASFARWLHPFHGLNREVHLKGPRLKGTDIDRLAQKAPTFEGLERLMRYCILRFAHTNGFSIDPRLGDNESSKL